MGLIWAKRLLGKADPSSGVKGIWQGGRGGGGGAEIQL